MSDEPQNALQEQWLRTIDGGGFFKREASFWRKMMSSSLNTLSQGDSQLPRGISICAVRQMGQECQACRSKVTGTFTEWTSTERAVCGSSTWRNSSRSSWQRQRMGASGTKAVGWRGKQRVGLILVIRNSWKKFLYISISGQKS